MKKILKISLIHSFKQVASVSSSIFLMMILFGLSMAVKTPAQDLSGFTKPLPDLQVFLTWPEDTTGESIRFNIYRKLSLDPEYPLAPLNAVPIEPITNCYEFMTYIPVASEEWALLSNAFADSITQEPLADVCSVTSFPIDSVGWERDMLLARAKTNIAIVLVLGYRDVTCIAGTEYNYQIRRVDGFGEELSLTGANEITITAGVPDPVPAAENIRIVIGDAMLQVLWNKPLAEYAAFNLFRATAMMGPYTKVNDADVSADIYLDLDSNDVVPLSNGFTDYERWDTLGNPAPRTVPGNMVPFTGPENGATYFYKVKLKDILGNESPFSGVVSGTPVDETSPSTPLGVIVTPVESTSSFEIKWPTVQLDVDGHKEKMASYKVYRYSDPENPNVGATLLPGVILHPPAIDSIYLYKTDSSPGLRSDCGEVTFYYRVEAIDEADNVSYRSVAVGNALKDTTKPPTPKGTTAEGFDDFIRIKWLVSEYCDTNIYLVYRALCDYGEWIPCDDKRSQEKQRPPREKTKEDTLKGTKEPKDCGGPFVLIGILPHWEARARATGDITYFDDMTVPEGSPLCYAYLVKAQDLSQNISGEFPIPDLAEEIVVCQRLRDKTPPEPGIISGLFALDSAIQVDYIGPPIQDIAAYHIYRSEDEEFGTYKWVGGMTVVPPPDIGVPLDSPYVPPPVVECDVIPLVSNEYMSAGTFIDSSVTPKQIYWYKALGVDQNGNETHVDSAVAISTFTFATQRAAPPEITGILPVDDPCALEISWSPPYDPNTMIGFVVFRSTNESGPYYQLDNIVEGNSFSNNSVARNIEYWYRVALLKKDGSLSQLSEPKNSIHP